MGRFRDVVLRAGLAAVLIAPAMAVGCTRSDAPTNDLTTTVDTTGQTVVVTNAGTPPSWDLTLTTSIGPSTILESERPEEFQRAVSVVVGPGGEIFVADAADEVRVFGPDGAHIRTFGREGEGPGEFVSLYSLAWVGDRLLSLDLGAGRIGEWSHGGRVAGPALRAGTGERVTVLSPLLSRRAGRGLRVLDGRAQGGRHVHHLRRQHERGRDRHGALPRPAAAQRRRRL